MFENVTWAMAGMVTLYVFIGLLARTFVPYFVTAWKLVQETNEWKLPRFEPKYVLPPAATLAAYVASVLFVKNALVDMAQMHPTVLILAVYVGEDLFRQGFKAVFG